MNLVGFIIRIKQFRLDALLQKHTKHTDGTQCGKTQYLFTLQQHSNPEMASRFIFQLLLKTNGFQFRNILKCIRDRAVHRGSQNAKSQGPVYCTEAGNEAFKGY